MTTLHFFCKNVLSSNLSPSPPHELIPKKNPKPVNSQEKDLPPRRSTSGGRGQSPSLGGPHTLRGDLQTLGSGTAEGTTDRTALPGWDPGPRWGGRDRSKAPARRSPRPGSGSLAGTGPAVNRAASSQTSPHLREEPRRETARTFFAIPRPKPAQRSREAAASSPPQGPEPARRHLPGHGHGPRHLPLRLLHSAKAAACPACTARRRAGLRAAGRARPFPSCRAGAMERAAVLRVKRKRGGTEPAEALLLACKRLRTECGGAQPVERSLFKLVATVTSKVPRPCRCFCRRAPGPA